MSCGTVDAIFTHMESRTFGYARVSTSEQNPDMQKAMNAIRTCVEESEMTVPEWKGKGYGPVYFISYADSSLVLATTIYYMPDYATETVLSDINMRVNDAFAKYGIEIPFNYVNVVMKK